MYTQKLDTFNGCKLFNVLHGQKLVHKKESNLAISISIPACVTSYTKKSLEEAEVARELGRQPVPRDGATDIPSDGATMPAARGSQLHNVLCVLEVSA